MLDAVNPELECFFMTPRSPFLSQIRCNATLMAGWLADATRHYYCCTFHINNKIHGKRRTPHPPLEVLPCRILKWYSYSWALLIQVQQQQLIGHSLLWLHKDRRKRKQKPNSCSFLSVSIVCNDTDIVGIFINYVFLFEISSWYKAVVFSQDP